MERRLRRPRHPPARTTQVPADGAPEPWLGSESSAIVERREDLLRHLPLRDARFDRAVLVDREAAANGVERALAPARAAALAARLREVLDHVGGIGFHLSVE